MLITFEIFQISSFSSYQEIFVIDFKVFEFTVTKIKLPSDVSSSHVHTLDRRITCYFIANEFLYFALHSSYTAIVIDIISRTRKLVHVRVNVLVLRV